MTDFFDSDIVREEALEMERLQTEAMELALTSPFSEGKEDQLKYISTVRKLIEKQQVFYMRLKLSDDPRAKDIKENIEQGAKMLYGWWETSDVLEMMNEMLEKLDQFEKEIEAGG